MKFRNVFWGLIFIIIGFLLICDKIFNMRIFSMSNMWPIFVLLPGLCFEVSYFVSGRKNSGILVPGGILTIIGLLFFFETYTNWNFSEYTWPIYIFAVSFGLFQTYIFSNSKEWGTLFASLLLAVLSVLFFLGMIYQNKLHDYINFSTIIGSVFILCGIAAILKSLLNKK